jgi:hypothetical protein
MEIEPGSARGEINPKCLLIFRISNNVRTCKLLRMSTMRAAYPDPDTQIVAEWPGHRPEGRHRTAERADSNAARSI